MRLSCLGLLVAALPATLAPSACQAILVINEFLPDPEGSDGGKEFVELLNTGPGPEPLGSVRLEFGNGADGAAWLTRWSGPEDAVLAPGDRYLIVDRNWLGDPQGQAEVYLGLQNGPDAIRLVRNNLVLDLVGYGPLTDPEMMEGDPADIEPGLSLSRRPDGRDTENNRSDFVVAEPTPGRDNFLPYDLSVVAWQLDPPSCDRTDLPVRCTIGVRNVGTEGFPVGSIILRIADREHRAHLDGLPPDGERLITWNFRSQARGLWPLEILVPLPGGADTLAVAAGSLQVGPAELILNEVLAVPRHDQGEWVELAAAAEVAVDLAGYSLRDEDGGWRELPAVRLEPGEFLVLAQDSVALASWHRENLENGAAGPCRAEVALARQRNLAGWPSLNNTPPDDRTFADRLYLADPTGDVIDHVTIGGGATLVGGSSDPGVSLARLSAVPRNPGAANWAPSTARTGSTPGCPNSVASVGEISMGLSIQPRVLDPRMGVTAVHFLFTLSEGQAGWELRVFDLWGVLVRDLGGEYLGPGPRDLLWDGRNDMGLPAGPGGYVVLLESLDPEYRRLASEKKLMVIR